MFRTMDVLMLQTICQYSYLGYYLVTLHSIRNTAWAFGLLTKAATTEDIPTKSALTLRLLMSYIYGAPILDVSRSHTTTQHSR